MSSISMSRRGFVAGAIAAAGLAASGAAFAEEPAFEVGAEFAPAAPVTYPADYLRDPDATWELFAKVEGGVNIEGLNFLGDDLYIIDVITHRVFQVVDGAAVTLYEDPEGVSMPNGAHMIDDHRMLITDVRRGLVVFDLQTGAYDSVATECDGEPFKGLNDLVLDGQGGAYFTDPGPSNCINPVGNVYYVNYGDGSFAVEKVATGFSYPNGIAISPDGQFLYVANFNANQVVRMPSKAYPGGPEKPYVVATLQGGNGPDGMIVDTEGNIWCAHFKAGEIVVIDPDGWTVDVIRLPECAMSRVTNLNIHDGWLYACEADQSVIWRIPVKKEMLEH